MVKPLELVNRDKWRAIPPHSTKKLQQPVTMVFCGLRTPSKECTSTEHCASLIRDIQARDMADGLPDIRYNFLIGGDEKVYEGRGWFNCPTLPGRYLTSTPNSLYVAFMGSLKIGGGERPSKKMTLSRNLLFEFGLDNKYINKKFLFFLLYKI